ncbi:lethal(3)malignant brain tumor-like protein 4 isoform X1 [Sphaerodactylus townsendi]|uniref:lethal(3)malignant brain tumor-like protein 4 isoform X1 n=2 Tax=Sphaerodactylus townsendi TaxID=933632 RepID=UPI002026A2EC|nr:lethal(3)malignant brain tumor-like protein 4 isoform X1 [Sphaerodactylus townsendi]XP_048355917.1 lethal(3)malignant brain tumor-like protein 4 isoform X1 [Sphaerodactylus townsendi]
MEQNLSEKKPAIAQTADFDVMGALDWKDGVATLPGSNIQFRLSEFGTLEIITEAEAKAARSLSASAVDTSSTVFHASTSSASRTIAACKPDAPLENIPSLKLQTCESLKRPGQMDGFENSRSCPQEHKDRVSKVSPADYGNRTSSSQVYEIERPSKRLRRKRKLLLDSEDEEDNADDDEEKNKLNLKNRKNAKPIKQVIPGKKYVWNWISYLEEERMMAVPLKLFKESQSFPQNKNGFKVGMKLEGLDPDHPSLFCVLSVAEVQGYRMRLHFDGYSECYDFWVNADSPDIHPVGWCEKTGHKLLPPKGYKEGEFNWASYLKSCKAQAAPKTLFKALSTPVTPSGFRVGMKLEAVDKKNPSLMCVATIADMLDNRLLIHFDNWDESYDYWCDASSPYIRPIGYCQETGTPLTTPAEYKDFKSFSWEKYLEETGSQAAPARAFKLRPPHGFQTNMKLEAVDKRNPILIRVATITDKDDYRIKIHFDGWDPVFDFWVDADNPDIHPMGWCAKTGHPLQIPLGTADSSEAVGQGCPTPGCQGLGHVRGPRYGTHYTLVSCPYSEINRNRESSIQDRLGGEKPSPNISILKPKKPEPSVPFSDLREDSPPSRKSSMQDGERSGRSSVHSLSEQSETSQEMDWTEAESSTLSKIKSKRIGCSHGYIKFQLMKQETDGRDPAFALQQALHQSVFMPSLSTNPIHRLHLCWEQHCKLLPEVSGLTAKNVAKWSVEEVACFVQRLPGCKDQATLFRQEQIDGEAFLLLNQSDIVKILSIKLGPALKIYNAILMFKTAEEA